MAAESTSLDDALHRLGQFFTGLSLHQRLLLGGGALLAGATLWAFVVLVGQPKYVTLYSGLRPGEAQALARRLTAKNIPQQVSADGTSLLVPEDKLDAGRLETAAAGLPRSARLGFELFDTPNWAGSDFTEKVNYQRALEGELERTLSTLTEVEAVRVHLVMPQDSLFTEQQHDAKAAVIVKTRDRPLTEEAQQAIPQLVASAVDRLRPENVTVIGADSNTPLLHNRDYAGGRAAFGLDEELARTVIHTLEPVVGPDHVRASVHVEYDLGTSEDTQESYDPRNTAALTQQHSEERSAGDAPAGVSAAANDTPPSATSVVHTTSRSDSTTYAVSKSLHHSVQPAGRLRRIAAAVLVDDAVDVTERAGQRTITRRKRTAAEMKEIERLASAALGIDAQRGDVLAVENLSFQAVPGETLPPPSTIDRWRRLIQPWAWALRYFGLAALFLVVYWVVLRPVKRQAVAAFRELPGRVTARLTPPAAGASLGTLQMAGGLDNEAQRATHLTRTLAEKVKAEPAAASRLIQAWITEEKSK